MAVIPLTLTISLCLVATFVLFFLRQSAHRAFSSAEHDAMLPLSDETPTPSLGTVATAPVRGTSQSLARRGRCGCSVGAEGHEDHAPDMGQAPAKASPACGERPSPPSLLPCILNNPSPP